MSAMVNAMRAMTLFPAAVFAVGKIWLFCKIGHVHSGLRHGVAA